MLSINDTYLTEPNAASVYSLNNYNSSWSRWLLNANNKSVTFKIDNDKGFMLSSQFIIIPDMAKTDNKKFRGGTQMTP